MDPVKILPTEVIESIFSYLSLNDLMSCCLVSQKWNFGANNDILWKEMCVKNGWTDCGNLKSHLNCFKILNTDSAKHAFNNLGDWKKHFVLKNQLQKNWRNGNSIDFVINPPKQVAENDVGNISSVSSDGHNLLAFGFSTGLLSLFNLKNNDNHLLLSKNCPLVTSVDYIEIINEYLVLIQENLFLIYKLEKADLELYRAKLINTSSVTDIDLEPLMLMDPNSRSELIREIRERIEDSVIYHFTKSHLVITTLFSQNIYVYDINGDFVEPFVIFNKKEMEINTSEKFILNVHSRNDVLYVVFSVCDDAFSVHNTNKFSIHAFSIKSKKLLFSNDVVNNRFVNESNECTIETNDRYLVLRFETDFFCVYDRVNGKLLLADRGIIFLNANSDPSLIGICLDIAFKITDPTIESCYFCFTLEDRPISLYSDVLVTSSVEIAQDGNGSTEVEFWNIYGTVEQIDSIHFPKNPNVVLIYKDDTKLIFYAERDHVLVRSFLA